MSKLLSPNVVAVIGQANLSEGAASHAAIEVKVSGTPPQIHRALKHLAKGGKKVLGKATVKSDVKAEPVKKAKKPSDGRPDEGSSVSDDASKVSDDKNESVSPRDFANNLLDS